MADVEEKLYQQITSKYSPKDFEELEVASQLLLDEARQIKNSRGMVDNIDLRSPAIEIAGIMRFAVLMHYTEKEHASELENIGYVNLRKKGL